jgi:ribose 1,5-bisphosphokinase PhnN
VIRKLFLIDGLAGAGKSDLLDFIARSHSRSATVISKFTTRRQRHPEEAITTDLKFVSEKKFAELRGEGLYAYDYAGKQYGFRRADVYDALESFENVFLIVRNRSLIEKLRAEFAELALVLPLFVYADRGLIVERLRSDGYDDETISVRLERSALSWKDYLEYPDSSVRVVINNSEKTDFHRKINALLEEFSTARIDAPDSIYINPSLRFDLIRPLVGFKAELARRLATYPYEKNIFVMMKFRDSNLSFFNYIKAEVERAGFNCVRADAPEWNITNNVYNPLAVLYCCKFGIALFDEPERQQAYNANVAYELGIMHNQEKQCLILTHTSLPNVPFDLVKDLRKPYSKETEFQRLFSHWLVEIR